MRVDLFENSYRPFCEMLRANGVDVIQNRMMGGIRHSLVGINIRYSRRIARCGGR